MRAGAAFVLTAAMLTGCTDGVGEQRAAVDSPPATPTLAAQDRYTIGGAAEDALLVERAYFHLPGTADVAETAAQRIVNPDVRAFAARIAERRRRDAATANDLVAALVLGVGGSDDNLQPALLALKADAERIRRSKGTDEEASRDFLLTLLSRDEYFAALVQDVLIKGQHRETVTFAGNLRRALDEDQTQARDLLLAVGIP